MLCNESIAYLSNLQFHVYSTVIYSLSLSAHWYLCSFSFIVLAANQSGWGWDGEMVHPKTIPGDATVNFSFLSSAGTEQAAPSDDTKETDEARLERINEYISKLRDLQQL